MNHDESKKALTKAHSLPTERTRFRTLLALNPNYFGNLAESSLAAVVSKAGDRQFEEVVCLGYQPQFDRLDAVVFVKEPSGYGGGICGLGTREYVRFYLSFDDGLSWQDQGVTSFQVFDIPAGTAGRKQLEYAIGVTVQPPKHFCFQANTIRARAILSWNHAPPANTPHYTPVWGNTIDAEIHVDSRILFKLSDVLEASKVKLPALLGKTVDLEQEVAAKPAALNLAELVDGYKGKGVEPHRLVLPALFKATFGQSPLGLGLSAVLDDLPPELAKLLVIDIDKLFPKQGDTRYEELYCVGYNPVEEKLVGVIKVKLSQGYSGGPCTQGSLEYVRFWADFDQDGVFETDLGLTAVRVHDIAPVPGGGLSYSAFLPVNFSKYRKPCHEGARVVPIRAVLSWASPPSDTDPNQPPIWGNHEDTLVFIGAGSGGNETVPVLSAVGDVPVLQIDGAGFATGSTMHSGLGLNHSPFGGRITLAGHISNPSSGLRYRIMRKPHAAPDSAYVPVTNEPVGLDLWLNTFDILTGWHQTLITEHADAQGYYTYEDFSANHSIEGSLLGEWFSNATDDAIVFDLRIDLSTDGNPAHDLHSQAVTVAVDNKGPDAELTLDAVVSGSCADFDKGVTFTGKFKATDAHFGGYSFVIRPPVQAHGTLPAPASGSYPAISDPGVPAGTFSLDTSAMDPCGYALTLQVSDRTNVNSGASYHYNEASVGFCVREKKAP